MVSADGAAPGVIDLERERGTDFERPFLQPSGMDEHVARLALRINYGKTHAFARHDAGVADLPARLAVERRLVEHDGAALVRAQGVDLLAVLDQRGDDALGGFRLVAEELGGAGLLAQGEPYRLGSGIAGARPRRARLLALAFHGRVEALRVDGDAARLERILRQVEGKAVGVVERERGLAGKLCAARKPLAALLEQR